MPDGFLNIDKPRGPSSHDIVRLLKKLLIRERSEKIGHTGTLDPSASGVLVICLGRANRLAEYVLQHPKEYIGIIRLGSTTDTLDSKGKITETKSIPEFSQDMLDEIAEKFMGRIMQIPPVISALKINGERYYVKARRGETFEPPPRATTVYNLKLERKDGENIVLRVKCASGFYVRSLARDIASALGTVGHLHELVRTSVGGFNLQDAITPEQIEIGGSEFVSKRIYTTDFPMDLLNRIQIPRNLVHRFLLGQILTLETGEYEIGVDSAIYFENMFLGVGIMESGENGHALRPKKVIARIEELSGL